jgi:hypothetical protein
MATTKPVSIRYTIEELRKLDETARLCGMSRAEVIHQRSLGKILTLHELAGWVEQAISAGTAQTKSQIKRGGRDGSRAA